METKSVNSVTLSDVVCDNCGKTLPSGAEILINDEVDLVFCDKECENDYFEVRE